MRYARTPLERSLLVFAALCLALAAVETAVLGFPGLQGALTFSGKLTGASLLLVSVVALVGSVVSVYLLAARPKPNAQVAAAHRQRLLLTVCLAASTVLTANLMILIAQFVVGDRTPILAVWVAFILASGLVLVVTILPVDARVPLPRKVAVGALVTGIAAVANFAYSQLYLPSKQEASIVATPVFGTPTKDADQGGVTVPFSVELSFRGQGVVILAARYDVAGRLASLSRQPRTLERFAQDVDQGFDPSVTTHASGMEPVEAGGLIEPGSYYRPGEEVKIHRFVRLPAPLRYDSVELDLYVEFVRADRARLIAENAENGADDLSYRWRLREASELYNRIRRPVTITMKWSYQTEDGQFKFPEVQYHGSVADVAERYGGSFKTEHTRLPLTNLT